MQVFDLDHLVLKVRDVERSLNWYHAMFGLPIESLTEWRSGERPFASLRVNDSTIIDVLAGDIDGENVDHIALVAGRSDFDRFVTEHRALIEMGPKSLSGARGQGDGVYLRDPDGHRVELRTYS